MQLRPIQSEAIEKAMQSFRRGGTYHLLEAPVAFGKTIFASHLISRAHREFGAKCLFLAHLKELVHQTAEKMERVDSGLSCGVFMGSRKEVRDVMIGTRQTVGKNLGKIGVINLLIIDEVHLYGPQYQEIVDHFLVLNPRLRVLGVTGTPYSLKEGFIYGEEKIWDEPFHSTTMTKMIEAGYLSKFRYKMAESMEEELEHVKKVAGEFKESELGEMMQEEHHLGSVQKAIEDHASDRKSILVFAVTIEHAERLADFLGCHAVHSKLQKNAWRNRVDRFKRGQDRILVNVSQLSIGFDAPCVDCVVIARPTMSPALHVQICGRGLRIDEGKDDCMFIDLVGNYLRHGLPSSPKIRKPKERDDREKKESDKANVCHECFEIVEGGETICPSCGAELTMKKTIIDRHEEMKMREILEEMAKPKVERFGEKKGHITKNGNYGSMFWVQVSTESKPFFRFCGSGTLKQIRTRDQINSLSVGDVVEVRQTAYGRWIA